MEEKNKSVKNVKVNQENVKKNFQYKLKRAVAIVGTVIVIGSGIVGIHFSREKKDKENVNSYLSGISVSESISEYEQLKQIKIEDIKDWLEISEDSIKYEDEVVKVIKDNIDYELDELPTGSLEEYESAVKKFNDIKDPSTVKEKEEKLKSAITIAKCAQDANEKLRKYGYNFVEKETLRLLKEDFAKHVGIEFDDPDKIEIGIVEDEWMTSYISVEDKTNGDNYECTGYPCDVAKTIGAVQRAEEGESKESDPFKRNKDRNDVLRDAVEACEAISSGATDEVNWDIKVPEEDDSKYYNPIECKAPSLNKIITSPK